MGDGLGELLPGALWLSCELELCLEHRQRRAQFVAGVGNEAPLPGERPPETAEEIVHRSREACELIPGRGYLDRACRVPLPNGRDLPAHALHGTESGPAEHPSADRCEKDRRPSSGQQPLLDTAEGLLRVVQGAADDHHPGPVGPPDGHGEEADVALLVP